MCCFFHYLNLSQLCLPIVAPCFQATDEPQHLFFWVSRPFADSLKAKAMKCSFCKMTGYLSGLESISEMDPQCVADMMLQEE